MNDKQIKSKTKTQTKNTTSKGKNTNSLKKIEFQTEQETDDISKIMKYMSDSFVEDSGRSVCDIIFANIIMLVAIFLSAFLPVVSIALPVLFFIYFEVGLSGFVYKLENGDEYRFETLFVSLKKYIKIFCVFVVKTVLCIFWTCMFIVPGVMCMLNYSFCGMILYESQDLDARGVLMLSKELVKGHRWTIFFYQLIALASICVAVSLMFFIIMFFDLFMDVPRTFYIIFITIAGFLDLILMAMPLVEITIADCYILAKKEKTANLQ